MHRFTSAIWKAAMVLAGLWLLTAMPPALAAEKGAALQGPRSWETFRTTLTFRLYRLPKGHYLAKQGLAYYGVNKTYPGTLMLFDGDGEPTQTVTAQGWIPIIFWPTPIDPDPAPPEPEPEPDCDPDTAPDGCECPQEFLGLDCDEEAGDAAGTFTTDVVVAFQ